MLFLLAMTIAAIIPFAALKLQFNKRKEIEKRSELGRQTAWSTKLNLSVENVIAKKFPFVNLSFEKTIDV